jgi:hypothetical protein
MGGLGLILKGSLPFRLLSEGQRLGLRGAEPRKWQLLLDDRVVLAACAAQ